MYNIELSLHSKVRNNLSKVNPPKIWLADIQYLLVYDSQIFTYGENISIVVIAENIH